MRLLLTNDDGIDAPGLQALEAAAGALGEVVVVAPVAAHSGCGHRVTTNAHLRIETLAADRIAVHGTPADCIRVALHGLVPEPTWVLAGINAGGNLGADIYHSGTVAAVREAAMRGLPGIAFSQYLRRDLPWDHDRARRWALLVLRQLLEQPLQAGEYWNVNFPHLDPGTPDPAMVTCPIETLPLPLSYRLDGQLLRYDGNYHQRGRQTGTDVDVCFGGRIAVTLLRAF